MELNQPYYIDKRQDSFSLDGEWEFLWADDICENVESLDFLYKATLPSSVYHTLWKRDILPHPYYDTNSKKYHWVDEKVWYYRKTFTSDKENASKDAYLIFEGISYYSKVWLNGHLLGCHEGMFGGPVVKVNQYLNYGGQNTVTVEVKAATYGKKDTYDYWNHKGENREIIPWNIVRDKGVSGGDFIVMGIWNHIRIEYTDKIHMSRPYLYTQKLEKDKAYLVFETEIIDGNVEEIRKDKKRELNCDGFMRAFDSGLTGKAKDEFFEIEIIIKDNDDIVYLSQEKVNFTDFDNLGMNSDYLEPQFYKKEIVIDNPELWYPNGMGEAFLYDVTVTLKCGEKITDVQKFPFGIRTFTVDYTKGNRYRTLWNKFLFNINGKEFFLKGINWMPIDYLYDLSPDRYEWCLRLVKNAGIQLLRVWNGGGFPESDLFYELCDKYGIMVWQDLMLANTPLSDSFPLEVLESQITFNLYRIRNHPSLVIVCGGNEFNPYTDENAANMFVTQRCVDTLIHDRVYYHTTADGGSAHIYIDMEPVWYRHYYKALPFLAESGIHSFPNFKTFKKYVKEEINKKLPPISSEKFGDICPGILNHFSEYIPDRVPRMTARISQITDVNKASLEELCEASQVQVYEFYQLMIQSMQENFPVCGGVMPWVFKRHWPTVGVQTVDGDDRPCYGYYAVKNAYNPVNVWWCQEWSVLKPNEEISLRVKVFNQNDEDLSDTSIILTVYNPDMTVYKEYISPYDNCVDFGNLTLDDLFTDRCFLVCADLVKEEKSIARSIYFNKCISKLKDKEFYHRLRTAPAENTVFEKEPRLKSEICNGRKAVLSAYITEITSENEMIILVKNISETAAYPVTVDVTDDEQRIYLSDNFFMLKPFEEKEIRITSDKGDIEEIKIGLWNGKDIIIKKETN